MITRTSDQPKKPPKTRKCRICRQEYRPRGPMQRVCSPDCAVNLAVLERNKRELTEKRATRKEIKARKEKIKTRSDYMKEAQIAFNGYIRTRDMAKPCICCGQPLESGSVGGAFDCGHYRSVGSAPHLRFDERNAHGQRKQCNRWGAGRAVDYRLGLIARLGAAAVDSLESDNTPKKWTVAELRAIRDLYRAKLRELKKGE